MIGVQLANISTIDALVILRAKGQLEHLVETSASCTPINIQRISVSSLPQNTNIWKLHARYEHDRSAHDKLQSSEALKDGPLCLA